MIPTWLAQGKGAETSVKDLAITEVKFNSLSKSVRLKARAILQANKVGQSLAPAPEVRRTSVHRLSAKQSAKVAPQARPAMRMLEPPLQEVPVRSGMSRAPRMRGGVPESRAIREKRIHVISFRVTQTELESMRLRRGKFKSLSRAARGLMIEVLRLGEAPRIYCQVDVVNSSGGCSKRLEEVKARMTIKA